MYIKMLFLVFFLGFLNLNAQPQFLVSYELVKTFSQEELKAKWKANKISEIITPVKTGVKVYEVLYKTRWHDGSEIIASGYYYVPTHIEKALPTLVMNHGTQLNREMEVSLSGLQVGCIAFAADGYVALYPHYIGLGKGEKTHLYQIAESEAFANIDMLRAIRELNKELHIQLNHQLFITGYSQGGHAAMATHKMIEAELNNEFPGGQSLIFDAKNDAVGIPSENPNLSDDTIAKVNEVIDAIKADKIEVKTEL